AARYHIRIVDRSASLSDVIALCEFHIRVGSQISQQRVHSLFAHRENTNFGPMKSSLMDSAVGLHSTKELGLGKIVLWFDEDTARHELMFLSLCHQDGQERTSQQSQPAKKHTRLPPVQTAETAQKSVFVDCRAHDAGGVSPSAKLAICQHERAA